ncbi:hypothetical protein PENTCL1PPCAC_4526, partial [Pristionchus entomophagus]
RGVVSILIEEEMNKIKKHTTGIMSKEDAWRLAESSVIRESAADADVSTNVQTGDDLRIHPPLQKGVMAVHADVNRNVSS